MATLRQIFVITTTEYGVSLLNDVVISVQVKLLVQQQQQHEEINKVKLNCFIKVFSVSILSKVRKLA